MCTPRLLFRTVTRGSLSSEEGICTNSSATPGYMSWPINNSWVLNEPAAKAANASLPTVPRRRLPSSTPIQAYITPSNTCASVTPIKELPAKVNKHFGVITSDDTDIPRGHVSPPSSPPPPAFAPTPAKAAFLINIIIHNTHPEEALEQLLYGHHHGGPSYYSTVLSFRTCQVLFPRPGPRQRKRGS